MTDVLRHFGVYAITDKEAAIGQFVLYYEEDSHWTKQDLDSFDYCKQEYLRGKSKRLFVKELGAW